MLVKNNPRLFSSRSSLIGIFTILVIILTVPLVVVFSGQTQDIRQRAAEPTPNLLPPIAGNGYISGYVYADKNKNGQRESEENGLANVQIKITQINQDPQAQKLNTNSDIITLLTTDSSGFFKYTFPTTQSNSLTFLVKLILPPGYKTIDTNPILLTNLPLDKKEILEFGLFNLSLPNTKANTIPVRKGD